MNDPARDKSSDQESSQEQQRTPWTRQQRRVYHAWMTCLYRWESQGYQMTWVMLSTASQGEAEALARHHATLLRRIERQWGYRGIEFLVVRTREGNGVLHLIWAWKPSAEMPWKHFSVPQRWLSNAWLEIHGASYVWIKRYRLGERSRRRLSAYVVTQYVSEQVGLVRYWWSWRRTFGVPMVAVWRLWRRMWLPYRGMRMCVETWRELIAGGEVGCLDGHRYSLRSFARGGP